MINPGARPTNELDEAAAAANVRGLFNAIAPTYDNLNHLLSMGLDRRWWNRTASTFRETLANPDARILDICCGTGDLTAALLKLRPPVCPTSGLSDVGSQNVQVQPIIGLDFSPQMLAVCPTSGLSDVGSQNVQVQPIIGLDFSPEMLARARTKYATANALWVEGDAMHLPYPDASFDLITAAFGFRNLTNYAAALTELHRVLAPGGRLGILECNQPSGLSGTFYNLYLHYGLPLIGGLLSGQRAAYAYLPASIARFPRPPQMLAMLTEAGFTTPNWDGYFLKAAGLYTATKQVVVSK